MFTVKKYKIFVTEIETVIKQETFTQHHVYLHNLALYTDH